MLVLLQVVSVLTACSSGGYGGRSELSSDEKLLVGRWRADTEIGNWVVTRKPDRTFSKNATITYDLSKPPASFHSRGTWRVESGEYVEFYSDVSNPIFASWRGKFFSYDILRPILSHNFEYTGSDAPIMVEKKQ